MNILFIYKFANYEPLGIMTLASVLKDAGHKCSYLDLHFENNISACIKKISPDIIAYSIITGSQKHYQHLNLKLKQEFSFTAVFGGPHCTFFPDFIHEEGVDVICRGEGENAMLTLANRLQNDEDITKIPNLWIKKDGEIFKNEIENLELNIDKIPFPDRGLVNKYRHYEKMQRRDVITTRGCPYNCSYCFNHANKEIHKHKGRYVRQRSVDNVIDELLILKQKNGAKIFHFQDDVFTVNRKWTFDFCHEYKLKIRLPFEVQLRVNLVDEDIVKALKDAGCVLAMYGIESGNDFIRKEILNRNISKEKIIEIALLFNKYNIRTMSVNMLGLPDESLEMAIETLHLNIKCKPNYAWNSIYQPYPMTSLSSYSISKGYFNGDINSFGSSFVFTNSNMKTPDIKKIERLHYLFPIAVEFPFLLPLIKLLIQIPLLFFYRFLFSIHRGYAALFTLKRVKISEIVLWERKQCS